MWKLDDGTEVSLLTPEAFLRLEPGDLVADIFGEVTAIEGPLKEIPGGFIQDQVSGVKFDTDTRGGYMAFGLVIKGGKPNGSDG